MPSAHGSPATISPFIDIRRADWAELPSASMPASLTPEGIDRIRGLGVPLDDAEVREVYLPLSRVLFLHAGGTRDLAERTAQFLQREPSPTPFVIGVAGSVAVGKSTVARLLVELLRSWPEEPQVQLVTTDGWLFPTAELTRRGLLGRKGFPESYDQRALLRFVTEVKSGRAEVRAPVYSHLTYDRVPDEEIVVRRPDILIVEGLNVLQPPQGHALAVSDLFDFSVYVDADPRHIQAWYVERFLALQRDAFARPDSHFHRYADLPEAAARETAQMIWQSVNEPNLRENIMPTRQRADLVLRKAADHSVERVLLRKG
ncbi:type I pantothenate kinase [Leucobacter sp. M11]|uniref:type I pantothenate kinase n=1 Tax=Leucobacter sp. M11 TaxID=2993565 RepID=UPI002D7E4D47|nr:type I pantothenate kinase [Leucobacter sp. M11]MEB4614153.1 type I pantothenate kinase [Leucobacter sp. M11]